MTAVMRAMSIAPITGPRLIRIGIVRGGRVIEERVIKDRSTVTVGSSETSTFIVSARGLTPEFPIFERVGNDYCLNIVDGMKGRIALPTGFTDLADLRGSAAYRRHLARVLVGDALREATSVPG